MNKEELIIYAIRTSEAIKEEKKQKLIYYVSNLEKENEKLHHYKTLYQSLKGQKEELRSWLVEQEKKSWDEVSSAFGYVLDKLEELEGVSNE